MRTVARCGVIIAAAVLGLTACGGDDDAGPSPGPDSPGATSEDSERGEASSVTVGALDSLEFDDDSYEASAGTVEFTYENEGSITHTLLIEGIDDFELAVGDTDTGSVELEAGTYTLYCDVAGHQGMEAELTVE